MASTFEICAFILFLIVNFIVGISYGKKVVDIRDYALGGRNFSTGAITATLVATWICGGFLSITISKTYTDGLYYVIPSLGWIFCILIIGYILAPRMGAFLGDISVAESLGKLYGKPVQAIAAICGMIGGIGLIALQFKVLAAAYSDFFGVDPLYALIITATVVTLYSVIGGIRSVTFTDILQFFTFTTIIPTLGIIILENLGSTDRIIEVLTKDPKYDFLNVLHYENPRFFEIVTLFIYFMIPSMSPEYTQRILMSKNQEQASNALMFSAIIITLLLIITSIIGFLIFCLNPNIESSVDIFGYTIRNFSYPGFRILLIIGLTAVVMSTADSMINSASILFGHDFCGSIGIKYNPLVLARLCAIFLGTASVVLAVSMDQLLGMFLFTQSFYMPIISVSFLLAIFGFRSTATSVYCGMLSGFVTVYLWRRFYEASTGVDPIIPGIFANTISTIAFHYIFKQNGGWVLKYKSYRSKPYKVFENSFLDRMGSFSIRDFISNNIPSDPKLYVYIGIYSIISSFSNIFSIYNKNMVDQRLLEFLYQSSLIISTMLIMTPIWPRIIETSKLSTALYFTSIFYTLLFTSALLMMINKLNNTQEMIFMLNIMVVATVFDWKLALSSIVACTLIAFEVKEYLIKLNAAEEFAIQLNMVYLLLITAIVIMIFSRPRQLKLEKSNFLNNSKTEEIHFLKGELERALSIKYETMDNMRHDIATPLTIVETMTDFLSNHWEKMHEDQRVETLKSVAENSRIVIDYIDDMIILTKAQNQHLALKYEKTNLLNLINSKITKCKKYYLDHKEIFFELLAENTNYDIECDFTQISRVINHVIRNAIFYSQDGKISISISDAQFLDIKNRSVEGVCIAIEDEGCGFSDEQKEMLFIPFLQARWNKTSARGHGIGLALSKKIIEAHSGKIEIQNKETGQGSIVKLYLPRSK